MRLFSRKHSRCCLASWRKNRHTPPLAGIRIFLACFESLCPKYVCFNISHQLIDSLHIYAKFSGQYLSGALLHKWTCLLAAERGKARAVTHQEVTTETEPPWFVWPRSSGWEERDGKATPRLQGPSHYSPPGLVTFCQSLCCVFIDAKHQAGVKVFSLHPTKQNIYQPWREILSALLRNELCSLAWHSDVRTHSFPSSGSRPMESSLQMLWHSMLDTTCRAWGSQETLSWLFAFCATPLKCANWNGCNGTLFGPFQRHSLE